MDRVDPEIRRKNMQAIKSSGSMIEKTLGKELWRRDFRYRKNYSRVIGKPDIAFPGYKIAIFCDSEFWHGKNFERTKIQIKSNKDFWYRKIKGNIKRDKEVNKKLKKDGWLVLRFWGKNILKSKEQCTQKIIKAIQKRKK